jgi:hypothetical protein
VTNLDLMAQRRAQQIVSTAMAGELDRGEAANQLDNVVTKTLGILQENGLYAATLFLWTRTRDVDRKAAEKIRMALLEVAGELTVGSDGKVRQPGEALKFLSEKVCSDLDRTLLVKQVWEQALIYARFAAKAEKEAA